MEFATREDDALLDDKMDYQSLQNEVESLRIKLQHVDTKSAQVDYLLAVIGTYKEVTGTVAIQLDSHAKKLSALERTYLSQRDKIQTLQIKLAAANEELADAKEKLADANEKLKIMEMIQRFGWPNDIQNINDHPPNPDQPISESRMAPKPKPWEKQGQGSSTWDLKTPQLESDVLRSEVQHDGTNRAAESADGSDQGESLLQAQVATGSDSPGTPNDPASSLQ